MMPLNKEPRKKRFDIQRPLSELLKGIYTLPTDIDRIVSGLSMDNRKIVRGDVFVALPGIHAHGNQFIDAAIERGAVAVLVDADHVELIWAENHQVPIIHIPQLKKLYGKIASKFYDEPSKAMTIIGITGTNGKSSIAYYLTACLQRLGKKAGIIGTLGYGQLGQLHPLLNTTPDAISVQRYLAELREQECEYVMMEVSSHALDQYRVVGIEFNVAIFTNLSRDHLDYHSNMQNYAQAKQRLFLEWALDCAIINADDEQGCELLKLLWGKKKIYAYSAAGRENFEFVDQVGLMAHVPTVSAHNVNLSNKGINARLHTPWGCAMLDSALLGRFNLSNILAVVTTLSALGFHIDEIVADMDQLPQVPGRMQTFTAPGKPLAIVDYAHTPDALEQVLRVAKETCTGKLTVVFGCGGARDKGKRPQMGAIAEKVADKIIITDDNSRDEEPTAIVEDILLGLQKPKKAIVEHDRAKAIALAIDTAKAKDTVLIAGKGHEDYQEIHGHRLDYSDIAIVENLLALNS